MLCVFVGLSFGSASDPIDLDLKKPWPGRFIFRYEKAYTWLKEIHKAYDNPNQTAQTGLYSHICMLRDQTYRLSFHPELIKDKENLIKKADQLKLVNVSVYVIQGQRVLHQVYSTGNGVNQDLTVMWLEAKYYDFKFLDVLMPVDGFIPGENVTEEGGQNEDLVEHVEARNEIESHKVEQEWFYEQDNPILQPVVLCTLTDEKIRRLRPLKNQALDCVLRQTQKGKIQLQKLALLPDDIQQLLPVCLLLRIKNQRMLDKLRDKELSLLEFQILLENLQKLSNLTEEKSFY